MKAKVLIIEDVSEMSDLISMYLQKEGIETLQCETAELALEKLESFEPDLVILDLNLPGIDGFEFLSRFRKNHTSPVMIVSARDADEDIISGLGYGADEFVTKPFSPKVLVARVRAMIRRVHEVPSNNLGEDCFCFGDYILDYNSFTLKKRISSTERPERIPLSAKEYDILCYLVANANKPLNPERIYAEVWKTEYGDISAVAVYIQRLRKKIEENPANPQFIKTIFGLGYCFSTNGEN